MKKLYRLEVPTVVPKSVVDVLVDNCPVQVAASGLTKSTAWVRFRAEDDDTAVRIADNITDTPGTLSTGFGVGYREVPR